jgi:hypothetical protein
MTQREGSEARVRIPNWRESEIIARRPNLGYLTISNALHWRLQYKRVIEKAGAVEGIFRVRWN